MNPIKLILLSKKQKLHYVLPVFHNDTRLETMTLFYFHSLFYLQHKMFPHVKIGVNGYNRVVFPGCRFYWSYLFLTPLKWRWQYCHSCIVDSLEKTLLKKLVNKLKQPGHCGQMVNEFDFVFESRSGNLPLLKYACGVRLTSCCAGIIHWQRCRARGESQGKYVVAFMLAPPFLLPAAAIAVHLSPN